MYQLSKHSLGRLTGVHPDLVRVVKRAIEKTDVDFGITEGVRSLERQKACLAAGKSWTLHSRHLTGHAIDVDAFVNGEVRWEWPLFERIAAAMKKAASELGVLVVWGGDWETLRDGCHFELDRRAYPSENSSGKDLASASRV